MAGLRFAPSLIETGLLTNISLGALTDASKVNREWDRFVDYDVDLAPWKCDVCVPPGYDGTTGARLTHTG